MYLGWFQILLQLVVLLDSSWKLVFVSRHYNVVCRQTGITVVVDWWEGEFILLARCQFEELLYLVVIGEKEIFKHPYSYVRYWEESRLLVYLFFSKNKSPDSQTKFVLRAVSCIPCNRRKSLKPRIHKYYNHILYHMWNFGLDSHMLNKKKNGQEKYAHFWEEKLDSARYV